MARKTLAQTTKTSHKLPNMASADAVDANAGNPALQLTSQSQDDLSGTDREALRQFAASLPKARNKTGRTEAAQEDLLESGHAVNAELVESQGASVLMAQASSDVRSDAGAGASNVKNSDSTSSTGSFAGLDQIPPTGMILGGIALLAVAGGGGGGGARDTVAPVLESVTFGSGRDTIILKFSETLDADRKPQLSAFVITVNGTPITAANLQVSGDTLTFTLTEAIGKGQTVSIAYTDPTAGDDAQAIQDAAGNDAATFAVSTSVVADGYVRGASLYLDSNGSGAFDEGDTSLNLQTDEFGNFFLLQGANPNNDTVIAVGGVNIDTGLPNTVPLMAPAGATVINPLTTLMAMGVSQEDIKAAFGLETTEDLLSYDPIASDDLAAQQAAAQIWALVSMDPDHAVLLLGAMASLLSADAGPPDWFSGVPNLDVAAIYAEANASLDPEAQITPPDGVQDVIDAIALAATIADIGLAQYGTTLPDLATSSDSGKSDTDNLTNAETLSISGNGRDGAVVTLFLDNNGDGLFDSGDTVLVDNATVSGGQFSIDINSADLSGDGTYNIRAFETFSGSTTVASRVLTVTLDNNADVGADLAVAVASGDELTNNTGKTSVSITLSGVDADADTVDVVFEDASGGTVSGSASLVSGSWVVADADLSSLVDGTITIKTTVTDLAGNTAETSGSLVLDTSADVDSNLALASGDALIGDAEKSAVTITLSGVDADADTVDVVFEDASGGTVSGSASLVSGSWVVTQDLSTLVDGTITIKATVTDLAGNTAETSGSLTLDTTADADSDLALAVASGDALTSNAEKTSVSITLSGVDADADTVDVVFEDASGGTVSGSASLVSGSWVVADADLSSLVDGTITIKTTVTDLAGNTAETSGSLVLDTVAPDQVSITPENGGSGSAAVYNEGDTLTITFSEAVSISTLEAAIIGVSGSASGAATLGSGSTVLASGGSGGYATTFVITLGAGVALNPGDTLTFASADVVDAAGNEASGSVVFDVPTLNSAPTIDVAPVFSQTAITLTASDADVGDTLGLYVRSSPSSAVSLGSLNNGTSTSITLSAQSGSAISGELTVEDPVGGQTGSGITVYLGTDSGEATLGNAAATSTLVIYGFGGQDSLVGGSAADQLFGGSGDDTLDGGSGSDTLTGGAGNDTYIVDAVGDSVVELSGGGTDTLVTTLASYSLASLANVENLTYSGSGNFTGTGNSGNNVITGGSGNDTLSGNGGNDTLDGGAGSGDVVLLGSGGDTVRVLRVESVTGGAGNDSITVAVGNTTINGGSGSDTVIFGNDSGGQTLHVSAVETVTGGSGSDSLVLSAAGTVTLTNVESVTGSSGADTITITAGATHVAAGSGGDSVTGGAGNDTLLGEADNDSLLGGDGNDSLDGGAGNDTLSGGSGDDTLIGGAGNDSIDGGSGSDTIVLTAAASNGSDTISGFTVGSGGDVLRFTNIVGGLEENNTSSGGAFSGGLAAFASNSNDSVNITGHLVLWDAGANKIGEVDSAAEIAAILNASGVNNDINVSLNGTAVILTGSSNSSTVYAWSVTNTGTSTVLDTEVTLIGTLTLASGNITSLDAANFAFSTDPLVTLDSVAGDNIINAAEASGGVTLTGSVLNSASQTLTVTVGGTSYVQGTSTELVVNGSAWTLNLTSAAITTLAPSDGSLTVEAVLKNSSGSTTSTSTQTVTVDRAAPTLTVGSVDISHDTGSSSGDFVTNLASQTITATLSAALSQGDQLFGSVDNGVTWIDITSFVSGSSVSWTGATLSGTSKIAFRVADAAGNVNDSSSKVDYVLDTSVPVVSLTSITEKTASGSEGLTLSGVSQDGSGSTVSVYNGVTLVGSTTAGASGAWTLDVAAQNSVTNFTISAKVVDLAGNEGTSTTQTGALGTTGNDTIAVSAASLVYGLAGNDSITGSSGADTLDGGAGNDTLDGGLGNDSMTGGAGDDTYIVGSGDTVVEAASGGTDTIITALGTYSLVALTAVENLTFSGSGAFTGTGNDLANSITGGSGNDTLIGGLGNDTLFGGAGNDSMTGGSGDDTYHVDASSGDIVVEVSGGGVDTVITTVATYSLASLTAVEHLIYSGSGAFTGTGNTLGNSITGGTGNDTLDGGLGSDTLTGGAGDDTYHVDASGDSVVEASGGGADTIITTLTTYSLASLTFVENLTYSGSGAFTGTGNDLANSITGGAGNDTLDGGSGDDTLDGGTGSDSMTGGAGNDTYVVGSGDTVVEAASGGTDTIVTALLSYSLALLTEVENLTYSGSGAFTGTGNALANILTGSTGNDTLDGGSGSDTLTGGTGNDTYYVDVSGDSVVEASSGGTDTIITTLATYSLASIANVENLTYSGSGAFTGTGNDLANSITGGAGNDALNGGSGGDTLTGGSGDDTLTGGEGADTLIGGAGNDTIVLDLSVGDRVVLSAASSNGNDLITNFTAGASGDLVALFATDTSVGTATGNAAAFTTITVTAVSGGLTYNLGAADLDGLVANSQNTGTLDVIELLGNEANCDLSLATNGSELLKYLAVSGGAAASITANGNTDKFYILAYDNGNAYLYQAVAGSPNSNKIISASTITLVATIDGVTSGSLDVNNFLIA